MKAVNEFWKVCEALDNPVRIELLRYLIEIEKDAFPCVMEIADAFRLGVSATSSYLKKLADVGLISSKRADKRVYYRAFATTHEGERVVEAFRRFFATLPDETRLRQLEKYVHTLSHPRRAAVVRLLYKFPGLDMKTLAAKTDMPYPTADRIVGELGKSHVVDVNSAVVRLGREPEDTLLGLTLG